MKRCNNSDCIRFVWDRDVNASINILNLFLELCYSANEYGKDQTLKAFTMIGVLVEKDFTESSILQFTKIKSFACTGSPQSMDHMMRQSPALSQCRHLQF
jgi:hypothetical protein